MEPGSPVRDPLPQPRGEESSKVELIKDPRSRQITFHKRKNGLLKKAMELSVKCDVEVCVIVFNKKNGKLFEYSEPSAEAVLRKYANFTGGGERRTKENFDDRAAARRNCNFPESELNLSAAAISAAEMAARRDNYVTKLEGQLPTRGETYSRGIMTRASRLGASLSSKQPRTKTKVLSTAASTAAHVPTSLSLKDEILRLPRVSPSLPEPSDAPSLASNPEECITPTYQGSALKSQSGGPESEEDVVSPVDLKRDDGITDGIQKVQSKRSIAASESLLAFKDLVSPVSGHRHEGKRKLEETDVISLAFSSEVDESESSDSISGTLSATNMHSSASLDIDHGDDEVIPEVSDSWDTVLPHVDLGQIGQAPLDLALNGGYLLDQILQGTDSLELPPPHNFPLSALELPPTEGGAGILDFSVASSRRDESRPLARATASDAETQSATGSQLRKRSHDELGDAMSSRHLRRRHDK